MPAKTAALPSLYLPALFCEMGAWKYYATTMRLRDVAERIRFARDLRHPERYDEWIQREIQPKRTEQISRYLLDQPERFFSSLVVTVYGGEPRWLDLGIVDSSELSLEDLSPLQLDSIDKALGLLFLSGDEDLFPIDGQHRLAGIRAAVQANPDRGNDTVSVLFVADRGTVETRRLFSTLNRYAVPVNQGERIILDEDDALAITTRRLIVEHPLLCNNRVAPPKRSSLSESDDTSFTTAVTLYSINNILCTKYYKGGEWSRKALTGSFRPDDEHLERIFQIGKHFWDLMSKHFPPVQSVIKKPAAAVSENRRPDGGHLLFRPAGQMAFARAIRSLHARNVPMEDAFAAFKKIPMELAKSPWLGLLWQSFPENRGRMVPTVQTQNVVAGLLLDWGGFASKKDRADLLVKYQKAMGNPDARLPRPSLRADPHGAKRK